MDEGRIYQNGVPYFPYWIAAYPKNFAAYLISEQKICLQFEKAQLKTRAPHSKLGLTTTKSGSHEMAISTQGTDLNGIAVGVPLFMYPVLIENILKAILEHSTKFPEHSIEQQIRDIINDF
jgi:hypothetical protein